MANASHNSETIPNAGIFVNSFIRQGVSCHTHCMERIVALALAEHDRLIWRRRLTSCYRETGDWTAYLMPPSVILPGPDSIDFFLDAGNGVFRHKGRPSWNGKASVLAINDERLSAFPGAGLFVSALPDPPPYDFNEGEVKVSDLLLIERDERSFNVIQRRPLRLKG